ncbi:methionine--tRNA ligase [Fictibacillus enclensis]|uniref:methionine--tRNA ligase n=1 Tax=Fictibacillus enclensis TaxID=1017270 RepID=UPI0025A17BE9|nr:methionine--tRNA ligase [Fictibacillus enclensis]MDM5337121.1 methionine--tRNA ligase [Fictibacillus enclensis]
MAIFIGGAWPYANGSLHTGHIASLLPGDILARYYRLKSEKVLYVSGSDCNGTPITIRARQEGITPEEVADRYHTEFENNFNALGFSYDCYTRTDHPHHHKIVQEIFLSLYKRGYIYPREIEQAYCETYEQFLPDRYVEGTCPVCGSHARGDQCDNCSTILDPSDLLDRTCKLCGKPPVFKRTEHLYFALRSFQQVLEKDVEEAEKKHTWRTNAIQLTKRYLREGLIDRAVSRDLSVGVSVPIEGYEKKKVYVWIEAVSGYYSASKLWAQLTGKDDSPFWQEDTVTYYVHGKDNIPFHTIIWPAILHGIGNPALPRHIVSNEYLTLEKKKLSTSKNWAVWVPDLLERYHPDSIRYFLTINAPENRDTDFSWREFIYSHNSELLGAYGNFVNRTLKFIEKSFNGQVPDGEIANIARDELPPLYDRIGSLIEESRIREGLDEIFSYIRSANKYFDEQQPWKQIKDKDQSRVNGTLATCVVIIANLAQLLEPFLPFSSQKVRETLKLDGASWEMVTPKDIVVSEVSPLFERIDLKQIDEEFKRLGNEF